MSRKNKGKALITKSDTESLSSDNDDDSDSDNQSDLDEDKEMMKLCALMVKGITKMAYKKFRKGKRFSKKSEGSDKKSYRKAEGKSLTGMTGETTMSHATIVVRKATYLLTVKSPSVTKQKHWSPRRKTGQTLQILRMR